jgi:hypothetical protein
MKFSMMALSKLLEIYSEQAALINERGTILAVNRAWKEFSSHPGLTVARACERTNYLEECERAHKTGKRCAATVGAGIRSVLSGASDRFSCRYHFGSAKAKQSFCLTAAPFSLFKNRRWAVILHANITQQRDMAVRFLRRNRRSAESVLVCAWCRLIAEGPDNWISLEEYFSARGVRVSHGICPRCVAGFALPPTRDTTGAAGPFGGYPR